MGKFIPLQEVMAVLGNLGEFIGAIAVVATLFYLAVQVRHGKEATEANTRSSEESRKIALVRTYQARAAESAASLRMFVDSDVARLTVKHIESGVAEILGLTVRARAHALAEIAHPDFRQSLRDEAERIG